MQQVKLFWYSNHPNIYNDYLFQEIHKNEFFNLQVNFLEKVKKSHPWKDKMGLGFDSVQLNDTGLVDWHNIKSIFKREKGSFHIVAGWNNLNYIVTILLLSILNKPYAIWSDTPNNFIKRNPIKRNLRQIFLKILFWRAKAFLVTGDSGVVEAKKMNIYKGNFINFPFATNINFFKPIKEKKIDLAMIKFLSVGRIDFNHKGQDVALQSFFDIKSKGFENFSWTIAGTGPDQDDLLNRIKKRSLEKEVRYLGWVEKEDVFKLYNSCDILIHSSYFDPFPNAVLEAMACGMVVVGSDLAGSVLDRINDGYNGYVHKAGSTKDLSRKLLKVLENTKSLNEMSRNARKTAMMWDVNYNLLVLKSLVIEKN